MDYNKDTYTSTGLICQDCGKHVTIATFVYDKTLGLGGTIIIGPTGHMVCNECLSHYDKGKNDINEQSFPVVVDCKLKQ